MHRVFAARCLVAFLGVSTLVVGCVTINLLPIPGPLQEEVLSGSGDPKVLLIELSGLISSHERAGLFQRPNVVAHFKEVLTAAESDPKVRAVVIRINSPGGTVTASDVLYHEIQAFKERRKVPVVASIMDLGTSGGYYVAAAADKIVAHPSSVTGSLGVIMLTVNASGLLEKIGVQATAIASSPKKDMGSPLRAMTPEERAIFQGVIDSFYQRFLTVVQEGRPKLGAKKIRELADGRIYAGEQAKQLGLVDEIGYLDDAIEIAKKEAGVETARVVLYRRPGDYRHNIYASFLGGGSSLAGLAELDLLSLVRGGTPQFLYLWMP